MVKIIKYEPRKQPLKVLIYGKSGTGKTFFGSTAPKPIFASAEDGLLGTSKDVEINFTKIESVDDLVSLFQYLKDEKHDFETVIIDSISEINELIKDRLEKQNKREVGLKDWIKVQKSIKQILKSFKGLDMNVIMIAQEKILTDEDGAIDQVVPLLNGKSSTDIAYSMDVVGYSFINKKGEYAITTKPNPRLISKCRGSFLGDCDNSNFTEWVNARNLISKKQNIEKKEEPKNPEEKKLQLNPPKE